MNMTEFDKAVIFLCHYAGFGVFLFGFASVVASAALTALALRSPPSNYYVTHQHILPTNSDGSNKQIPVTIRMRED